MSIYASGWKGTGTSNDPFVPAAVLDISQPWRSVVFPECVFTNTFDSAMLMEEIEVGEKIILVANTIDEVVSDWARNQLKAQFNFTVNSGETLRMVATRRGVNILPELGIE